MWLLSLLNKRLTVQGWEGLVGGRLYYWTGWWNEEKGRRSPKSRYRSNGLPVCVFIWVYLFLCMCVLLCVFSLFWWQPVFVCVWVCVNVPVSLCVCVGLRVKGRKDLGASVGVAVLKGGGGQCAKLLYREMDRMDWRCRAVIGRWDDAALAQLQRWDVG